MTPVGGSRHYTGAGLGQEGVWSCPSCGGENTGPIAEGCQLCGAGKPGYRVETTPPPTFTPPAESEEPPPAQPPHVTLAQVWLDRHPEATLEEAFKAGFAAGLYSARQEQRTRPPEPVFTREGIVNRTLIAALALFRDQILAAAPEEIRSGEWMSAREVNELIRQLQEQIVAPPEVARV